MKHKLKNVNILLYLTLLYLCIVDVETYFQKVIQLVDHIKPYQVTIFTNRSMKNVKAQGNFFHEIINQFSTMTIDLNQVKNAKDKRTMNLPTFKNPRKSSIFIIFTKGYLQNFDIEALLNAVTTSTISMRPKCLLIFLSKTNLFKTEVKKLLKYAWNRNFLDFTVMYFNSSVFISYNPFTRTYKFNGNEIFPDKIKNVNKYPLTMPVFNSEPQLLVDLEKEKVLKVHGQSYEYIEVILNKLNFEPRYVLESTESDFKNFNRIFENLEQGKYDLIPIAFMTNTFLYGRKFIIGRTVFDNEITVIVPIIKKSRFNFSSKILIFIVSFPMIIFIFFGLSKIFKLEPRRWTVLYIYQIFIGYTAKPSEKLVGRIFFLLFAILSIVYTNIFFSSLGEMKIVSYELPFNTYQDLMDSKIKICTRFPPSNHDTPEIQSFLTYATKVESIYDCLDKSFEKPLAIIVLPLVRAKYFVNRHLDSKGLPMMKLAGPRFHHQYTAFPSAKSSPFSEKFDDIIQRIKESGLDKVVRFKEKKEIHWNVTSERTVSEDTLVGQLMIVAVVGYLCALTIFVKEMVYYYFFAFQI